MRFATFAISWIALLLFSGMAPIRAQTQPSQGANSSTKESGNGVYRVGGDISAPRRVYTPDPEYSEQARQAKVSGACVLRVVVDPTGLPRDITVEKPLGMGLDEQAIAAVRTWRFTPAMKGGVPVAVQVNVEVSFRISYDLDEKHQKLLEKADAGDTKTQFEISQDFLSGRGVPTDESRGLVYLGKAAKHGLPKAQFAMGEYFSSHKNDLVTAYVWYALAQRSRYKHSDKRMKELAEKMTPEQLVEAHRRVDSNSPF